MFKCHLLQKMFYFSPEVIRYLISLRHVSASTDIKDMGVVSLAMLCYHLLIDARLLTPLR